ncbi:hypothetical protein CHGG_07412 [Chaetomium globosum CBS 148.51]|uniref:NADH:flavin oxidoreductase/NADH oxidase N-terminal domain-containing protein n=1 Tax=Chaetomium globosum (strain ATCC 6205 / CBS 148.51 / DSM 1962 / NBRC 6347 / NRRL 1970) TaxID=306901 RepID=Q2GX92_CHAGB|nr:uncharacterized protein CHGG_07412 [Chaetomium globosum CBS 148.51]EAQ86159.1 hypothetical protein CHGG_07412 [Chaetomium globosum CBS 148.51]
MGEPSDLQIAQPLTLKCGLTLPNRLVKAAMAEQMAGPNQLPDERMLTLYKHWAQGGWGLIITGVGGQMIWGNDGPDGAQEEKSDRTRAREAFFLEFARLIRKEFPDVPLMVTGGFSSRGGMEKAVVDGDCDLIGLARPAVLNPSLPNNLVLNPEVKDQDARVYRKKNKTPWFAKFIGLPIIGAGMDSIHAMAKA